MDTVGTLPTQLPYWLEATVAHPWFVTDAHQEIRELLSSFPSVSMVTVCTEQHEECSRVEISFDLFSLEVSDCREITQRTIDLPGICKAVAYPESSRS